MDDFREVSAVAADIFLYNGILAECGFHYFPGHEKMDTKYPEYSLPERNKDVGKTHRQQEYGQVKSIKRPVEYKGKKVNVTLEFPTDADSMEAVHSGAQQEFENLLKKIYLDRIKPELDHNA